MQYKKNDDDFIVKEKRDNALTVRLPSSVLKKIKKISKKYNRSQSEIIEKLVNRYWIEKEIDYPTRGKGNE